jgi:hypothetical protein
MSSGVNDIADESCVTILDQRSVQIREKTFTFDHVFGDETTQVRDGVHEAVETIVDFVFPAVGRAL